MKFDAIVDQRFGLIWRRCPMNCSDLGLAVMHPARLIGEATTNVVGMGDDMVTQFFDFLAQFPFFR